MEVIREEGTMGRNGQIYNNKYQMEYFVVVRVQQGQNKILNMKGKPMIRNVGMGGGEGE